MNAEAELESFVSFGLRLSLLWDVSAPFLHWIFFLPPSKNYFWLAPDRLSVTIPD